MVIFMYTDRWFAKAEIFFELAHESIGKMRFDFASFSAQQAVEFFIKGLLIKKIGAKAYSHSLIELIAALEATGISVPKEIKDCIKELGEHYLQARYPDARVTDYTKSEAEEAINCMEVTVDFLRKIRKKTP
jgi:HEPN domain-containing protein